MFNYNNQYHYGSMPMGSQNYGYPTSPYQNYANNNQGVGQQQFNNSNTTTNTNKIFVSGIEDARRQVLPPNSDYFFLDNDEPYLYQKIVDGKGQFEIKKFKISPESDLNDTKSVDPKTLSNFALKTDLDPLQAEIKAINDKLTKLSVQKQIDNIKNDK